jgi:AcrR family transcriptional regulator
MHPAPLSDRRPYVRDSEEARRAALVAAVLDLVAEGGVEAATLRAVAARAGVTPGLIRHYFGDKDGLMRVAYGRMMQGMVDPCLAAAVAAGEDPVARLRAYLAAALDPAALDGRTVALWAAYIHRTRQDAALRAAHETGYLAFRDALEALIAALPVCALPPRDAAIALNALLDGLWLEGGLLPQGFAPGEVQRIALTAAARLLELPEMSETKGPRS